MAKQVEIHAYHGWGFEASIWENWNEILPAKFSFKAADRGYFGHPFTPEFTHSDSLKIVFTHSFGLHCISDEISPQVDLWVVFNGFDSFHPDGWSQKRRSKKVLKQMMKQFQVHPMRVLKAFFRNCFHPQKKHANISDWLNKSLLLADLKALHKSNLRISLKPGSKVFLIGAGRDQIVEGNREASLSKKLPVSGTYIFAQAGHGLPFVNSKECWSYLCRVIPIFGEYGHSDK